MRILVTGPRGFVGSRIMDALPGAIAAPSLRNMEEKDVQRLTAETVPDVIIHTAAISDIGTCERNPEASYRANVEIPLWLAKTGAKTLLFSTDQVYSGCAGEGPYLENETAPANLYARHKLEMERRVLDANPDAVLLRATWMYDMPRYGTPNRGNFLMNMLKAVGGAAEYSAAEYRGITYVREVAEKTVEAIRLPGGVYNFGSENDRGMLDTASFLAEALQLPIRLSDCGPRHNLWMNCQKLRLSGICFDSTLDGLRRCIRDYALGKAE